MKNVKKIQLQIGVIGSMADLGITDESKRFCEELGELIAKKGYTLVFGAEKDSDSLPTIAARNAKKCGGITIGVTYGKGLKTYDDSASVTIATGLVRGGGRELVQALSCDGIIAVSGGSGTLNEVTVAYQAGIPVVCTESFGGWSGRLAGSCLDERERYVFGVCDTPSEALEKVEAMIQLRRNYDKS